MHLLAFIKVYTKMLGPATKIMYSYYEHKMENVCESELTSCSKALNIYSPRARKYIYENLWNLTEFRPDNRVGKFEINTTLA
jgi:hypothetical protein